MKYLILLSTAALFLLNCKSKKVASTSTEVVKFTPTDKELAEALKTWPNTTISELKEGHSIYIKQCTECHENFEITKFSEKKWKHEIDDMSPKAKLMPDQKDKLTKFILSYRSANAVAEK